LPDMAFSIVILPEAAERTRERVEFFFAGDASMRADLSSARAAGAQFITSVNAEDVAIVESVQRGRHSPAFVGGQFAPAQEETSLQFQKMVAASLLATDGRGRPESVVSLPTRDIVHPTAGTGEPIT
jgi:choline monooxygenase